MNDGSVVEKIKARLPIEEIIGSYIKLEKAGKSLKARCPFHNEKTASFFVSPERGGYYCFGCNAKGDIFTFVEQFEGLDFKGALKILAEKAGVPLVYDKKVDGERDKLFEIMESATRFFEEHLTKDTEALEYIKSRGLKTETVKNFRIGYAPLGWKNLHTYLKKKGWGDYMVEKAGLIKRGAQDGAGQGSTGNYYDRFRGRIIFPITDTSGRVIAFTGRILRDDGKSAKYLNSPDTPIFDKSMVLFGLDKAKSEIRRMGYSILVEGQVDLIMSHQAGIKNAVASSGTALTDEVKNELGIVSNLGLVKRLSPNIIIAMDSDSAGRKAAMRAVASTALAMGMSVKIASIEGGKDPADLISSNPEDWKKTLREAKHVVEYELGNVVGEVRDHHKLARAVKDRIFPFLSKIESDMDKAFYIKLVAEKMGVNESSVWEDLRRYESEKRKEADQKVSVAQKGGSGQKQHPRSHDLDRIDLIEKRMFGLLALMEGARLVSAPEYRSEIKKISGDLYEAKIKRMEPLLDDAIFEAEAFYGKDQDRWSVHMGELILNFEEDMISQDLVETMGKLKVAENEGKTDLVSELAKKCQALSIRKAEVAKRRNI